MANIDCCKKPQKKQLKEKEKKFFLFLPKLYTQQFFQIFIVFAHINYNI